MGQKSEPARFNQVYVVGLDPKGKPRGARFAVLKDSIVSAAMDLDCRILINQPEAVTLLGANLPIGRVYGTGRLVKLLIPNIAPMLYNRILEAARIADEWEAAWMEAATSRTIH
jgi:hypothetical protein